MQDLVPWPGIKPWPPALGVWNVKCWSTQEVPQGVILQGQRQKFLKNDLSLPLKKKKTAYTKIDPCVHAYIWFQEF